MNKLTETEIKEKNIYLCKLVINDPTVGSGFGVSLAEAENYLQNNK